MKLTNIILDLDNGMGVRIKGNKTPLRAMEVNLKSKYNAGDEDKELRITRKQVKRIGNKLGIRWKTPDQKLSTKWFCINELTQGTNVELEHGSKISKETNITKDDPVESFKIALAHLKEIPDYYTRLAKMERGAGIEDDQEENLSTKAFEATKQTKGYGSIHNHTIAEVAHTKALGVLGKEDPLRKKHIDARNYHREHIPSKREERLEMRHVFGDGDVRTIKDDKSPDNAFKGAKRRSITMDADDEAKYKIVKERKNGGMVHTIGGLTQREHVQLADKHRNTDKGFYHKNAFHELSKYFSKRDTDEPELIILLDNDIDEMVENPHFHIQQSAKHLLAAQAAKNDPGKFKFHLGMSKYHSARVKEIRGQGAQQ
jgi:hypothetical protein